MSKKLVLLTEGKGDRDALPTLTRKLLTDYDAWNYVRPDKADPIRVSGISGLAAKGFAKWKRYINLARTSRQGLSAILVVLDGDADHFPPGSKNPFCATEAGKTLAKVARDELAAGKLFSLAVVIACREYESWLIGSASSMAGKECDDGTVALTVGTLPPTTNLEESPRDAKGWLTDHRPRNRPYKPTSHQAQLTNLIDLQLVRQRNDLRSFRRLEHALQEIIEAMKSGQHICTPGN